MLLPNKAGPLALKETLGTFLHWQGSILLRLVAGLALFPAFLFFFQISINPWFFPLIGLAILAWAAWDGIKLFSSNRRLVLLGLLLAVILTAICLLVSAWFFDFSFDGRYYHFFAVQLLKGGWNPVYDPRIATTIFNQSWIKWVLLYPKATWYAGAVLSSFFGGSEIAKAPNLLLMLAVFFVAAGNLLRFSRLAGWQVVFLSLALALNPVQVTQVFSKYVDGQVSACLTIVLIVLAASFVKFDRLNWICFGAAVLYCVGIKYSVVFYLAVFMACAGLLLIWRTHSSRKFWTLVGVSVISTLGGLLIVGYNPYVANTILDHNPIYPLTLADQEIIMGVNRPHDFNNADRFKRFAKSILAPSSNAAGEIESPPPKIPFSAAPSELDVFVTTDVRTGGFGPWFSGLLLVAGLGWLYILRTRPKLAVTGLIASLPILLSIFSSEEGWWARYAPQTWLLPLLVLLGIWYLPASRIKKIFSVVFCLVILVNLAMVLGPNFNFNFQQSSTTHVQLDKLAASHETQMMYCNFYCDAATDILQDYQIPFQKASRLDQLACPQVVYDVYLSPLDCSPP